MKLFDKLDTWICIKNNVAKEKFKRITDGATVLNNYLIFIIRYSSLCE